ncbi:MAG: DUF5320 domain-containing protein [Anaerolineales bacterium]|nr:DUF5320 domain-containing protein [Anaerolineales bacterium]
MPRGDRTGPAGAGSLTGRRAGYCAGNPVPGFANPGVAYGRGWGNWFHATGLPAWTRMAASPAYAPPSGEQELAFLKEEAKGLKNQLDAVNQRIAELESGQ